MEKNNTMRRSAQKLLNHVLVENVSFSYGQQQVLKNVNIQIGVGEKVVIIGPSGCGKTTLLNLLTGYDLPNAGKITVKGVMRTVFQQGSLFPWLTVAENIGMGLRQITDTALREGKLKELLQLINMEDFEDHYPHQLSGGMRQRVELGRVLAGESDIILMDEPFSSLDYQARIRIRRELIALLKKKPKTVVMVTHDIEEAVQVADRILVLSSRPSTVCQELPVRVPHPRHSSDPELIRIAEVILQQLGLETI